MMKHILIYIFCFVSLYPIYCQRRLEAVTQLRTSTNDNVQADISLKYIYLFCGIVVAALVRYVVRAYDIPIAADFFLVVAGVLWGIGAVYDDWMKRMCNMSIHAVENIINIYLPALVFSTAFYIDSHPFQKSLLQILIIGIPIGFMCACTIGFLMSLVINVDLANTEALLFGALLMPIYPIGVLRWLKISNNLHMKYVKILLEGEILISSCAALTVVSVLCGFIEGWIKTAYHFFMQVLWGYGAGIPLSYLYGQFGVYLMRKTYHDTLGIMLVTIAMCYTTYYYLFWMCNGGIIGTVLVGLIMGRQRTSLSKTLESAVIDLWKMIMYTMESFLYINIGVVAPLILHGEISPSMVLLVFVTYLLTNITRLTTFFLFSPILSRLGYGMTFQNMVVCVWAGARNPICLAMILEIYDTTFEGQNDKAHIFFLHIISLYILMLFVNGSCAPILMKALGLSEIPLSRQVNMNNCMKTIYEARARTIAILKMDRFLSDVNWPLVMDATALSHPFKKLMEQRPTRDVKDNEQEEEDLGDEYHFGYKFTFCPDCKKNVPKEPTQKELKEMMKEAKLRLLKLKKSSYSRQFENGMISKNGIGIMLQNVEIAMDTEKLVIELNGLFCLFNREGFIYRCLRNFFKHFLKTPEQEYNPPRKRWRLRCYQIVNNVFFFVIITVILIANILAIVHHDLNGQKESDSLISVEIGFYTYITFFVIYLIEFALKIFALSWIYIWKHGFYFYFKKYWNVFEFITLISVLTGAGIQITRRHYTHQIVACILLSLLSVRVFHSVFLILNVFRFCHTFNDTIIKFLYAKVDRYRALAYELGKSFIVGEEEILEYLPQIIDNDIIRVTIKENIENDRLAVVRRLGLAQKESPRVAITVKTKLAMRTVLNSMKLEVQELKISGWVDDIEYHKLLKSLSERYTYISSIKTIEPLSPKLIFREIPFMGDESELISFLYSKVTTKKFEPGDVLIHEGENVEGVYVVITGMFSLKYTPKNEYTQPLKDYGVVPIVDYLASLTFEETLQDYIVPGNTIGELCILTGRPYSSTITAETYSQVYVISKDVLKTAFKRDSDPVRGLECRMWKCVSFRKALNILSNVPSYRARCKDNMKFTLERSFLPDLSNYKVFVVNEMMEDILLIEGVTVDYNTRHIYIAPCYVPRTVQKLVLPKSSLINFNVVIETKLLIIPAKEYNEYEIMVTEEDICELVNEDSALCLRHLIDRKSLIALRASKSFKTKNVMSGGMKKGMGGDSTKSRITTSSSKGSKV